MELYFNDIPIGFQQSGEDREYRFDDLPLVFGLNEFRLVFHGPQGQLRTEIHSFLLEQALIEPGEFYYRIAAHRDRDDHRIRAIAQFDWGLYRNLSVTGGILSLSVAGEQRHYLNWGLRAFWRSFFFNSDIAWSEDGGSMAELGLRTRLGGFRIGLSHALLNNFTSDVFRPRADPVESHSEMRIDGAIPGYFLHRLPLTLEVRHERLQSGRDNIEARARIAAYLYGTSIAHQWRWQRFGDRESADGTLRLGHRLGRHGLRGEISYGLRPDNEIKTINLTMDSRLQPGYLLSMGITRGFVNPETRYTIGLNKTLGAYGLGIGAGYSTRGEITFGAQLFMAFGREPRTAKWLVDARPMADMGAVSARVFLDKTLTGIIDADDEPIQGVGFTVNRGRHRARTNAEGIAYLNRLPVKQHADIAVDTSTLEDPQWTPRLKGVRLVPRPGSVNEVDFLLIITSEIDGTVYLLDDRGERGIGDVLLEVLDGQGNVVSQARSAADGFYIAESVPPGDYTLRVSPEQLQRLQLKAPPPRAITVPPDGDFISGMDFILESDRP